MAPISLEAIEQVQVSVAPYDVRQGNFVGAGVNTVTRSGTNSYTGSAYTRYRNEDFVGKTAKGNAFNPGTFKTKATGGWAVPGALFVGITVAAILIGLAAGRDRKVSAAEPEPRDAAAQPLLSR